jgi:hypothetical protein
MPSGGARPNSGRPKGSKNQKTKAMAKITLAAMEAGITPMDFLLAVMRNEALDTSLRMDAAKSVAAYCHPRLAATVVASADSEGGPMTVIINRFADGSGLITAGPAGPSHPKTIEHQ